MPRSARPAGVGNTDRLLKEAKAAVKEQLDLHRPLVEALEELIGAEILEVLREAEAGLAGPMPARVAPSLLARRPAPPAEVADPGPAG